MSISLTLGQASRALEVVQRLATFRFPSGQQRAAYELNKVRRLLLAEAECLHAQRREIIKDLGDARPATPQELSQGAEAEIYEVPQGSAKWAEFVSRLNELLEIQITLECNPLTLAAVDLSADDIDALGELLAEPQ